MSSALRPLLTRCVELLALLFGITTLLFFLLRISGDPATIIAGEQATPELLAEIRAAYGFDRHEPIPLPVLAPAVAASLALGLVCAEVLGHPASREPAYLRLKQRIRQLSQAAGH